MRDPEATRRRILDAAIELLASGGDAAVRVAEVARAAGTSVSAIYGHFRDRDDLVAAARAEQVRGRALEDAASARTLLTTSSAPGPELNAALAGFMVQPDDPDRRAVRRSRVDALVAADHHPRLTAEVEAAARELMDTYTDLVDLAKARGAIDPAIDSRSLALFVQTVALGMVLSDAAPDVVPDAAPWRSLMERIYRSFLPPDAIA